VLGELLHAFEPLDHILRQNTLLETVHVVRDGSAKIGELFDILLKLSAALYRGIFLATKENSSRECGRS
jgi:hypothetical protein